MASSFHAGEPPSRVQGVNVTKTVLDSSPTLKVSWSAVSGSNITYTVCYSRKLSTQPDRWSNGNCGTSGITGTSTTLGPLSGGTIYTIWVRAVSSGGRGPDSGIVKQKTCIGKLYVLYDGNLQIADNLILQRIHNFWFFMYNVTVSF